MSSPAPTADRSSSTAPDLEVVAASMRMSIARMARLLRQQDRSGLTPSMHTAMVSVWLHGPLTLGRLAALEQVTAPTISKLVDKLEQQGLVARTSDPDDGRVCRVAITDAGAAQVDDIRSRRTEWLAARLATLAPEDRARLGDVMEVLEHLVAVPDPEPAPRRTERP